MTANNKRPTLTKAEAELRVLEAKRSAADAKAAVARQLRDAEERAITAMEENARSLADAQLAKKRLMAEATRVARVLPSGGSDHVLEISGALPAPVAALRRLSGEEFSGLGT